MNSTGKWKLFVIVGFIICAVASLIFVWAVRNKNVIDIPQKNIEKNEDIQAPMVISESVLEGEVEEKKAMPNEIPIFMYHYIRDYADPSDPIGVNLSVSPEKFAEQLAWLVQNGYQTVPMDFFANPQTVSFKPIVLSFDDGYQDAFDSALPILQKYKMTGIFYLIVNKIGTPGYLTWDEISQMKKAGMVFGSHTLTHPDLRNLSDANLEKEIGESRKIMEDHLGGAVADFCYPSGKYDARALRELQSDGYKTAVTTASGISALKDDPYLLRRLRITNDSKIPALLLQ